MILLSAFAPFGSDEINSSFEVLNAVTALLDRSTVQLVTLPVSFERCTTVLFEAMEHFQPETVLCFGQAAGRATITIETRAVNSVGDALDSDGMSHAGTPILTDAPMKIATTLPVDLLLNAARSQGVDAQRSHSAGDYVCNYLFYKLQQHESIQQRRSGFIHLPIIEEQLAVHPDSSYVSLSDQILAVRAMIDALKVV